MNSQEEVMCIIATGRYSMKRKTETVTGGALLKKVFLKISQISQENICAGVSF